MIYINKALSHEGKKQLRKTAMPSFAEEFTKISMSKAEKKVAERKVFRGQLKGALSDIAAAGVGAGVGMGAGMVVQALGTKLLGKPLAATNAAHWIIPMGGAVTGMAVGPMFQRMLAERAQRGEAREARLREMYGVT